MIAGLDSGFGSGGVWASVALAASSAVAGVWTWAAIRSLRMAARVSFLGPPGEVGEPVEAVDVIVPARNEEGGIGETLGDLAAQEGVRVRLFVVDDHSTDRTGEIVRRFAESASIPVRTPVPAARPAGWVGKTWAVHQGWLASEAEREREREREGEGGGSDSGAEWVAFVDADARLHPRALAAAIAAAREHGADAVSLVPGYDCRTWGQRAVAIALSHLLWQLYPLPKVNAPREVSETGFAHGVFILAKREAYRRAGTHEAVRHEIVEDILLGRRLKDSGARPHARGAPELVRTHAYGTLGEVWRGLRKNAYAGMEYRPEKLITGAVGGLAMGWIPVAALAWGLAGGGWGLALAGAWGWAAQAAAAAPVCRHLGLGLGWGLLMPVGLTIYIGIALASAWDFARGRVVWKDVTLSSRTVTGRDRDRDGEGVRDGEG